MHPSPFRSYHASQRITNIVVCLSMTLAVTTVLGMSTTEFGSVFHEPMKYRQYKKCMCARAHVQVCTCGCTQRSKEGIGPSGAGDI